jgi:TPR repeat protein
VSVAVGIDRCHDVAEAAFRAREYGLALRAWRLALPYDGDGTAIDNKGGPKDYPNLRLNVGLALRDMTQFEEARAELQRAAACGHPDAMVELGILLFTGKGGPERREEAMDLFNRAMAEARDFAHPQGRQPAYPCEYRRDQARTFINAVRQRGINIRFAQ